MQLCDLYRTIPAITLMLVVHACSASGPVGSAPPMNLPFDSYDACIRNLPPLHIWQTAKLEAEQRSCLAQTIQVNHLALPAGATPEQAYAKYKECIKNNEHIGVLAGQDERPSTIWSKSEPDYQLNGTGNKLNTARQACFTSALQ